jgi:hypothetical protein
MRVKPLSELDARKVSNSLRLGPEYRVGEILRALEGRERYRYFYDWRGVLAAMASADEVEGWKALLVSAAATARVQRKADEDGGALHLLIDNADAEDADAALYHGDELTFDIDGIDLVEIRAKVITPGTGVTIVFGMGGAHNLDKDTMAQNAWFRCEGGLSCVVETDDGTNDNDDKGGKTLVTDTYYRFVMDMRDTSNVKFFIDGEQQAAGTLFDMSNYTGNLQPYLSADKAAGDGAVGGALIADYFMVEGSRAS